MSWIKRLFILGGCALLEGCVAIAPSEKSSEGARPSASTVLIDARHRYQVMDGFGASVLPDFEAFERGHFDDVVPKGVSYKTTPQQRTAILTAAVQELGLTHLRLWLPIGSAEPLSDSSHPDKWDWSTYNWAGETGKPQAENMLANRNNGLVGWGEFLRTTMPLGLRDWIVTPGWLPNWLQKKFTEHSGDEYDRYADWAVANLLYLKQHFGFEAPYWSIHNEPDNLGWINVDFWHRMIRTTGSRFRQAGLATKLMVPDFMDAGRAVELMTTVLRSQETRQYIGALAYHHYRTSGDGPQPFLEITSSPATANHGQKYEQITVAARAMATLGEQYHLPSWQTETAYYPANYRGLAEWEIGRARANEIYYELSSGASAVEGMFLFWPEAIDPRYDTNVRSEGHPIVLLTDGNKVKRWTVTKDAGAVFAHYGRYVRPGDSRVAADCADPMIRATAFISENNRRSVVVAINNSTRPKATVFEIEGLPWQSTSCRALITTARKTLAPFPINRPEKDARNSCMVVLPALSVCTIVWSAAAVETLALPAEILTR